MPIPPYVTFLRERIGHAPILAPAAAAVIRDEAGRVLLIRRGDNGRWSLPGGMMEPGERIADCLVREVWEETGLEVEPLRVVGVYSDPAETYVTYPNGDQVHFVSTTFECRVVGGALRPDGEESLEVAYFAPEAMPETLLPGHRARVADALLRRESAFFR
jgi:8-oxo-dGTP diphosphatase